MRITSHPANRNWPRPLFLVLALLLWGCSAVAREGAQRNARQGASTAAEQDNPLPNSSVIRFVHDPDPAPPFALKDLAGNALSLDSSRGKVTLLNFWATWCPPCRAEIPDLIELQAKYTGKLQVIGLSVDEDAPAVVEKFAQEFHLNYPVAIAPPELRSFYGGIPSLPTSFLLDTQGRVVQKHIGLRDPALYETEIRALLGLPIQARVETFADTGEIFLRHADRATQLPGVNMAALTPEQKKIALRRFNSENCTCPCNLTLAQCRVNDSACPVSKAITAKIISEITAAAPRGPELAKPTKAVKHER